MSPQESANKSRSPDAMAPFQNSHAMIYGAATGIGQAVAIEFARRGASVAIADINMAGAEETAAKIAASGGKATAISCDVTSEASVRSAAETAEKRLGDVNIVMNNVGVVPNGNPEDIPVTEWRRIMDLSYFAVIHSNAYFLPKLLERGRGHIINTASFAGFYPYAANRMPYVAAKAAIIALTESLALYLHPKGIRASCLIPGPVMTRVTDGMKSWSTNVAFRGPGSQYKVVQPEQAATILADGMRDGRILIPTDEKVWAVVREHAANPDAFIDKKIAEVASGDLGMPTM